jgi:hypothetical protein
MNVFSQIVSSVTSLFTKKNSDTTPIHTRSVTKTTTHKISATFGHLFAHHTSSAFVGAHKSLAVIVIFVMAFGPVTPVIDIAFAEDEVPAVSAPAEAPATPSEAPAPDPVVSENTTETASATENTTDVSPENTGTPDTISDGNSLVIPDEVTDTPQTPADTTSTPSIEESPETDETTATTDTEETTTDTDSPNAQAPPEDVPSNVPGGETVPVEDAVITNENTNETDTVETEETVPTENLETTDTVIEGTIEATPAVVVQGNLVSVKIADFDIPGKTEGDILSDEEAFATILKLTTQKQALIPEEKSVVDFVFNCSN